MQQEICVVCKKAPEANAVVLADALRSHKTGAFLLGNTICGDAGADVVLIIKLVSDCGFEVVTQGSAVPKQPPQNLSQTPSPEFRSELRMFP